MLHLSELAGDTAPLYLRTLSRYTNAIIIIITSRRNGSTSDVFSKVTIVDDAHMYWTHGCGLWGSGQKESRGLAD